MQGDETGAIDVLLMGQSNAVGADPDSTGAVFSAHPDVTVWDEAACAWVVPTVGQEPFNPSGSNNAGLEFCNRIAEETGQPVRLMVIADGSLPISEWTGSHANRAVSTTNRPKYRELQAAMASTDFAPQVMIWIQGEANGGGVSSYYVSEFSYLISEMDADGYLSCNTAIIVSQLYQGRFGEKGNRASINAVNANSFIDRLTDLGDPRLRIANSARLAARENERSEGNQKAGVHFTDHSLRTLGRHRIYAAWQQARECFQEPVDFGLEMSRTDDGLIGSHLWSGGVVPNDIPHTATLTVRQLGQLIDLKNNTTIYLPDFTHPTKYSSALKVRRGFTVYFRLISTGQAAIGIEPGGTGGLVKRGSLYDTGAKVSGMVIPAGHPSDAHKIYMARWQGGFWEIYLIGG